VRWLAWFDSISSINGRHRFGVLAADDSQWVGFESVFNSAIFPCHPFHAQT